MKKVLIVSTAAIVVGLVVAGCNSTTNAVNPTTSATPAGNATNGQQLYTTNCVACHGTTGAGGVKLGDATSADIRGPALADAYKNDVSLIKRAILTGKDQDNEDLDAAMPRWQGKLTDQNVADIIAYLQTLK